jgi:RNA methyltransferase, TrmH family
MITSKDNPKIKQVRALQADSKTRREAGAFVVEGVRLVEEALASGWPARWVIYTDGLDPRGQAVVTGYTQQGAQGEQVTSQVMRSVSDTESPQGILAVLEARALLLSAVQNFIFIPDGVRDPGNLGTMLRTAGAAGVQSVLLPPCSVDPYSPKVLRAAMGAHFRLPLHSVEWDEIERIIKRAGLMVYLADSGGGEAYTRIDWRAPLALIVGGEAAGAGPEARALAAQKVFIPMPGGGESLNVATAAAILLFEAVRQRTSP